ncbi:MAG: response regulator, partial [Burkholderiales bacterium]|nr:response regulator [Burkholderiales bacterium]
MNASNSQDKQSPTILIVDDTPANIGVLVDYLEDHAYRVVVAQDGEEALSRAQFAQPDLILLDVMMPGMDGFETCARLKTMQDVKDIPVIFMTALTDTSDKVKGFGAGGVDYVTKPFQIEEILARIHTHLSLRLMQRQVAEQNLLLQQEITIREQAEQSLLSSYEDLKLSKQQQEQLHQQLLQSEKMASIGQLAAGVAHEINNPIAFVNSNLSALQQYVEEMWSVIDADEQLENTLNEPSDALNKIRQLRAHLDLPFIREDLQHLLGESLEGIQRVRRIVQDLRDFSHVGEIEKQLSNLHHGLDST